MAYVIISKRTGERVRTKNGLTPVFKYVAQATKYITNYLNDSPYLTVARVGK